VFFGRTVELLGCYVGPKCQIAWQFKWQFCVYL